MEHRVIELRQVRSLDQVLSATFAFIRLSFKPLFKSLLAIAGPFLLLGGLFAGFSITTIISVIGSGPFASAETGFSFLGFGIAMLIILGGYLSIFTATYAYVRLYNDLHGRAPSVQEVWNLTRKNLLRMMGTGIVLMIFSWLVQLGISLVVGIFTIVVGEILGLLVNLLLLPLYAFLMNGIALVFMIRMQEPIGVINAISRSFNLIQGYWWQTFGIVFIVYMIIIIISIIALAPPVILGVMQMSLGGNDSSFIYTLLIILFSIVALFFAMAISSLYNVAMAFQYYNLVERKEAVGLRERISDLEDITPPEGAA